MRLTDLIAFCKRRGIIFQSSEIYDGLNGFWDYGPIGVEMKRNVRQAWWDDMITRHNPLVKPHDAPSTYSMLGLDTAIIMNPAVWRASGHYDLFHDKMVDCRETKMRYRYDQVRGRWVSARGTEIFATLPADTEGEEEALIARALKHFGLKKDSADQLNWRGAVTTLNHVPDLSRVLAPDAKTLGTLTEPRGFNLMFKSYVGPVEDERNVAYLRPETAQGTFVNFKNVVDTCRVTFPFGLAQTGKSFRNEVTPRQFLFRSREFEQMEMEFFCHPADSGAWYQYWRKRRYDWYVQLSLSPERLRLRDHAKDELSHYSTGTADIEYAFPFLPEGEFGEIEGIAHRGDFDLRSHTEGKLDPRSVPLAVERTSEGKPKWPGSGVKLNYRDPKTAEIFVPHVIEPAAGLDRVLMAILCDALDEDTAPDESGQPQKRTVLRVHPRIAAYKAAVFPLTRKDGMPEIARELFGALLAECPTLYDDKDSIGKRYRRADELGVPICITVDGQSAADRTVTFRHRDTFSQWRVRLDECAAQLKAALQSFSSMTR